MGPYIPPGQSPPFQVVDDLHHGAWVIIAVALGLVFSLVSFSIRLYVRLALHPPFAYDDFILLGATVTAVAQATLLFEACAQGFGTSIDLLKSNHVNTIQILVIISDILYLLILYATKCSVVGIYLRLTPQKLHNRASWATLALCTLWIVPAIFILAINCGFNRPWKGTGGQCGDLLARWQFIVALDIVTELILFSLAIILLAGLFMPLKRKLTIGFAFVFRLPTIIFAVFHIYSLQKNINSLDPTLAAVRPIIWAQVELHYALIACSVFCLRPFMAAVSTNYGTAGDSTLESSRDASRNNNSNSKSGSGSRTRETVVIDNQSQVMSVLQQAQQEPPIMNRSRPVLNGEDGRVPSDLQTVQSIELVGNGGWGSVGSDRSAKMIIRKDVQYTVEYNGLGSKMDSHAETEYWDRYHEAQRS